MAGLVGDQAVDGSGLAGFIERFGQLLLMPTEDQHLGALRREQARGGAPDAGGAAGDDDGFAGERGLIRLGLGLGHADHGILLRRDGTADQRG